MPPRNVLRFPHPLLKAPWGAAADASVTALVDDLHRAASRKDDVSRRKRYA